MESQVTVRTFSSNSVFPFKTTNGYSSVEIVVVSYIQITFTS